MSVDFDNSRIGDILNAELARAGESGGLPCAGYTLLLTTMLRRGVPWGFIRLVLPDLRWAILIANSKDAKAQSEILTAMLAAEAALAKDLRDREET